VGNLFQLFHSVFAKRDARYHRLMLVESYLTRRLFGSMLRRMEALPLPAG